MARTNIDVGSNANDGTGDDLRSAFISVNANFTELYAASPVSSQITIEGNQITTASSNADLVIGASGTGAIVFPAITINDNNITGTRSNENLVISASGTGNIILGALKINGTTISSDDSSAINFAESDVTLGSINISGNVITSTDSSTISFGGETLSGVANPTQATDVATKDYVDSSGNTFGNLEITSNTLQNAVTNSNLILATVGTGNIQIMNNAEIASSSIVHVGSSSPSGQVLDSFVLATYRGGKYLVSISDSTNSRYETVEIYITHDGTTPYLSSSGVSSTGSSMVTWSADVSSGLVRILIQPISSDSCQYRWFKTLFRV